MSEKITKFRAQYPEYDGLSDQELADKLYDKFYSGRIPRDDYYAKLGMAPAGPGPAPPEGAPEVRSAFIDQAKASGTKEDAAKAVIKTLSGTFGLGTDDAQIQDMVKEQFPDATFREVEGGAVATINGKDYWINRPGVSGQDMDNIASAAAVAAPLAPLGLAGASTLANLATGAVIGGGTEVSMDVLAQTEGSKQPPNLARAGIAAAAGGALDALAPHIIKGLGRWFKGGRKAVVNGQLSPEIQRLLKVNGIDPTNVSPQTMSAFEQIVKKTNPDDMVAAFRMAEAQGLPGSPQLMTQQATQTWPDYQRMDMANRGQLGDAAKNAAIAGQVEQGKTLKGSAEAIQQSLGGQGLAPGQGAKNAQAALVEAKTGLKEQVDAAYEAARGLTGDAAVPKDDLIGFHRGLVQTLDDAGFDLEEMPRLAKYLGQIEGGSGSVKELQKLRSRLSTAASSVAGSDPAQAQALRNAKDSLDGFLVQMASDGKITGDKAVLAAWQEAIAKRAELGAAFQDKDLVSALVETTGRDGRLKVSPDDAANAIFGSGLSKKDMAINLGKIRQRLGGTSDAWKGLKEEAFLRLFKGQPQGEGAAAMLSGRFKPSNYNSALESFLRDYPEAAAQLFSKGEIEQMKLLGKVVDMAYGLRPIPQNVNPSGSGVFLAGMKDRILRNLGFVGDLGGGFLKKIFSPVSEFRAGRAISDMTKGVLPSTKPKAVLSPLAPMGAN